VSEVIDGGGDGAGGGGGELNLFEQLPTSSVTTSGPGEWVVTNESMSARAAAYQEQITGVSAGDGYLVGGVKFDGYDGGQLIDAKGPGYGKFVGANDEFYNWFRGSRALAAQAEQQLEAAGGTPITWYIAESRADFAIQQALADHGVYGINFVYAPPND